MYYYIAPDLKLIFAWSPKCACTTIKSAVLMALGHEITGNVHNDMLTPQNLRSGKYGVYNLSPYRQTANIKLHHFLKVCVIRNPYSRYISAIRQRSRFLCEQEQFRGMTACDYLKYLELNNCGEDHHFHLQTKNLKKFSFDRVLDLSQMAEFFNVLKLDYNGQRFGKHGTIYDLAKTSLHSASLHDLMELKQVPESIRGWLDPDGIARLRTLYADDFDFAGVHGFDYDLGETN